MGGMVPCGVTFLSGAPKTRKTFLALQMAAAVASGKEFLDCPTTQCDVAYLDLEGSKYRAAARAEKTERRPGRRTARTDSGERTARQEKTVRTEKQEKVEKAGRTEQHDRVAQNTNYHYNNHPHRYHDGSDGLISIVKDRQIAEVHPTELKEIDSGITKNGILEIMPEGYGFIRCDNFLPGENDVYVAPQFIRRFGLRTGDIIEGNLKMFYYRGLKEWNNEKGYLTDTCLTAQDKYKVYLDYFRIAYL